MAVKTAPKTKATAGPRMRVDPITFEILRHRLWSINEEGANTLERVSGSLIASEVHDMNTSIMTATGDSLVIAPYMLVHAISMETIAKDVVATCADNPGIRPDDMFLTNDPFAGAQHQMDVVVLGRHPLRGRAHRLGRLDDPPDRPRRTGPGPGAGRREGHLRRAAAVPADEDRRGRRAAQRPGAPVPAHVARRRDGAARPHRDDRREQRREGARPGALPAVRRRDGEGGDAGHARLTAKHRMRARLRELPDGTWRHRSYLEYDDKIYTGGLRDDEEGRHAHLRLPRVVRRRRRPSSTTRSTRPISDVLCCVMTYLCWDMPWVPAGVGRAVKFESDPGHDRPRRVARRRLEGDDQRDAGGDQPRRQRARQAAGRVGRAPRARDGELGRQPHAPRSCSAPTSAASRSARRCSTRTSAAAARAARKDGVDTGGYVGSISRSRRTPRPTSSSTRSSICSGATRPDSGGGGHVPRRRGLHAVVHRARRRADPDQDHAHLAARSSRSPPASAAAVRVRRTSSSSSATPTCESAWRTARSRRSSPSSPASWDIQKVIAWSYLDHDDVYQVRTQSGGGYGDPLDREPARVLRGRAQRRRVRRGRAATCTAWSSTSRRTPWTPARPTARARRSGSAVATAAKPVERRRRRRRKIERRRAGRRSTSSCAIVRDGGAAVIQLPLRPRAWATRRRTSRTAR